MNVSIGWLFVFLGLFLSSDLAQAGLLDRLHEEQKAPTIASSNLNSYQFIFVDGFMGDVMGTNFIPAAKVLKSWAIDDPVLIHPASINPIEMNAEILYKQILETRSESQKPHALIVAHSKAGPELFLAILHHPELITQGYITQFVIIDGALEGTPLADLWTFVCGDGTPPKLQSRQDLILCKKIAPFGPSLEAMRPSHVQPMLESAISVVAPEVLNEISAHLFTIRSRWGKLKDEWSSPLAAPHYYLQRFFGDNDGVILLKGQRFPHNLGEELAIFDIDHLGLLHDTKSEKKESYREAVMRAIITEMVSRPPLK